MMLYLYGGTRTRIKIVYDDTNVSNVTKSIQCVCVCECFFYIENNTYDCLNKCFILHLAYTEIHSVYYTFKSAINFCYFESNFIVFEQNKRCSIISFFWNKL